MSVDAEVIEDVAAATPDWLTKRLRASGTVPAGATVTAIGAERVGTGQMGTCDRLRLTWADPSPEVPATLVLKLASANPAVRAAMGGTGFASEVGFYRDLAAGVSCRTAGCHHAAHDPGTGTFTLLLDDLAPATQGDQLAGLDLAEAEACIDELAALHASRWGDPTLPDEPVLASVSQNLGMAQAVYGMVMPGFLDRFGHAVDDAGREVLELCTTGTDLWRRRGPSALTLVHGDFRNDNLLFDRTVDPVRVTPVDWQGVHVSAGQVDVAFLLATSVDPGVVAGHEEQLLRRWYEGLGARGVTGYGWSACLEDFRWASIAGLQTTVFGAAFSDPSERGEEMFVRMVTGQLGQIARLGAADLLRPG